MINLVASPWASTAFAKEAQASDFRRGEGWQSRCHHFPLSRSFGGCCLSTPSRSCERKPMCAKYPGTQQEAEVDRRLGRCSFFQTSEACGCYEVSGFFEAVFPAFDDDNGYFFCEVVMWAASRNLALWPQHSIHRLAHGCTYHSSAEEGVFNQATCAICQEVHPQCLCLEWP